MKTNKYNYYRVIQACYGNVWEDVDFHEADSQYTALNRKELLENVKAYRDNLHGQSAVRVINRKELK